jgi:hypothetical protein
MKTITFVGIRGSAFAPGLLAALTFIAGCTYVSEPGRSEQGLNSVATRSSAGAIPGNIRLLEVENSFGSIRVITVETEPPQWSWKLMMQAQTDPLAQQWADASKCEETQAEGTLRLAVSLPESSGARRAQSDLEIRVPSSISVRTRNRFGRTEISGVKGDVDATGQNGAIELREIGGAVRAQTAFASLSADRTGPAILRNQNGRINATIVRGDLDAATSFGHLEAEEISGNVKARNQNGRIEISGVKGRADIQTSFATLRVEAVQGDATLANQNGQIDAREISGSVKAHTSFARMDVESTGSKVECHNRNGSIRILATSSQLASVEAETAFARLEVRLPAGLKPAIEARTSFADIESDFPVLLKPKGEDSFANLEPGAPRIRLRNQNGPIRVFCESAVAQGAR